MDEESDAFAFVCASDADVVHSGVDAQGDDAGVIDAVVSYSVVGFFVAAARWLGFRHARVEGCRGRQVGQGAVGSPVVVFVGELVEQGLQFGDGADADMVGFTGFTGYVGGKFDESEKLREQAKANSLEQFLGSPDLSTAFMDAVIDSDTNLRTMSEQVLGDKKIQRTILALLAREFYEKHGREGAA